LSGNDNILNEAHYVVSSISIFLKNAEFVIVSINISSLSGAETTFGYGADQKIKSFVLLRNCQEPASTRNVQWKWGLCTLSIHWI